MALTEAVFRENFIGELAELLLCNDDFSWREIEEVRLRTGRRVTVRCHHGEQVLRKGNKEVVLSEEMLHRSVMVLSKSSFYAFEEEMRQGYLTIKGGHRVGLCGETVLEAGQIQTLKNISSLNFRIAREVKGAAVPLLPYLCDENGPRRCLIASPPAVGKTTVLRDLARIFGSGDGVAPLNVGIADERGEIAGSFLGVPQMDVGERTDVMSGCLKADGVMMLIRAMAPRLVLTDEIGRKNDALALMDALNCGVIVIATAHGASYEELRKRPVIRELLQWKFFERVILIERTRTGIYPKAVYGEGGERLC